MATGRAKARKSPLQPNDPIEIEHEAFLKKLPALLQRYEGRFVAIYRGRVVGHDSDDEELARRMYRKYGEAPFYVARVERAPTVYELPSPEIAR
jgi:hypothetical protein